VRQTVTWSSTLVAAAVV